VVTAWFLTMVLNQTPGIQTELGARLEYTRGLQHRRDAATVEFSLADFREAAHQLEAIRDGNSPALDLALGNAQFLAGDLPLAIAAYLRGLAIDPADAKLRTALTYAREQVQYPPRAEVLRPARELWASWLSLRSLGVYSFALYVAGCATFTRWRMSRQRQWISVAITAFALAAIPAVGSGLEWWRSRRDAAEPVVVVNRDVPLRAGNGGDYPAKVALPRGCEVRRLFERGGWLQVETGGGLAGWLPADAVVD
jgi:hypothetical protein